MEINSLETLLISQRRAAMTEGGPLFAKKIRKVFKRICRHQRNLQINNHSGCTVNLIVLNYANEEIGQLIMECKGNINQMRP